MSVKHKISGFFTAIILAIVSFFVIFIFLPEYSEKYLGTSIKSDKKAQKTVATAAADLVDVANKEATETLTTVKDRFQDFFKK